MASLCAQQVQHNIHLQQVNSDMEMRYNEMATLYTQQVQENIYLQHANTALVRILAILENA